MRLLPTLVASAVLTCAACSAAVPATEVLVVVDATDSVTARATRLDVVVQASAVREGPFTTVDATSYGPPASRIQFPRRVALVPAHHDAGRYFEVHATARAADRSQLATATVRSTYAEHRVVELHITLDDTPCVPQCGPTEQCSSGLCTPIWVDPGGLPDHDAGPDAAVDGGPAPGDGGGSDLGMDAGGCRTDADCDDHDPCDGIERCMGSVCVRGVPLGCDDFVACTVDACDSTVACTHTPSLTLCSTGATACDPVYGCQYGGCDATNCAADAATCTGATCMGATCVRNHLCTAGQDCCAGGCVAAGCDDGDPCTTDVCGMGGCIHTTSMLGCDDGNPCTDDSCSRTAGCVHTDNTVSVCDPGAAAGCVVSGHCAFGSCVPDLGCGGAVCCDSFCCGMGEVCCGGGVCIVPGSGSICG